MWKCLIFVTGALLFGGATQSIYACSARHISEISVEQQSSWQGSMYKYTFKCDGSATMVTPNYKTSEPPKVTYQGTSSGFTKLDRLLTAQGFFKLRNEYLDADVFDANTVIVTAVRNGRRYTVTEYAKSGPANLSVIQESLVRLGKNIKWEHAASQPRN